LNLRRDYATKISERKSQRISEAFVRAPRRDTPEAVESQKTSIKSAGWTGLEPAASGVTGTRRGFLMIQPETKCKDFNYL
jgi:hypothetical protein